MPSSSVRCFEVKDQMQRTYTQTNEIVKFSILIEQFLSPALSILVQGISARNQVCLVSLKVSCVLCSFSFSSSFSYVCCLYYTLVWDYVVILYILPCYFEKEKEKKKCSCNSLTLGIWIKSRYWRMDLSVTKGSVHAWLCRGESFVQHRFSSLKSPAEAKNKMNQTWQKSQQYKELMVYM
jgi:hypothetical protein